MYDRAETAAANTRFWNAIRDKLIQDGIPAPHALNRDLSEWQIWQHPDLLLAQTCGLPFSSKLHGTTRLVATPDYGHDGCPPGFYHSIIVVRQTDATDPPASFATRRLAINSAQSQSGWGAAHAYAASLGFAFQNVVETGSHTASMQRVKANQADIAFLDPVSWRLMQMFDDVRDLAVLDVTEPTPSLPYITATDHGALLCEALRLAVDALGQSDRELIGIKGLTDIAASAYLSVPIPPKPPAQHVHGSEISG